jgi:hypothetical protein
MADTVIAGVHRDWVGEAMQKTKDDRAGPKPNTTGAATKILAANRRPLRPAAEEQPVTTPHERCATTRRRSPLLCGRN